MILSLCFVLSSNVNADSSCVSIINNLKYGDTDINKNGEVSTLQKFLQTEKYLNTGSTGYFGSLTLKAVKNFQQENGISSTGYVGILSRAKINSCLQNSNDETNKKEYSPSVSLNSSTKEISNGLGVELTWTSENVTSCGASWADNIAVSSDLTYGPIYNRHIVFPSSTTTYSIFCQGKYGNAKDSVTVKVLGDVDKSSLKENNLINVILPDGKNIYKPGQDIIVKWSSSDISSDSNLELGLYKYDGSDFALIDSSKTVINNGYYLFNIPKTTESGSYKIIIHLVGNPYNGESETFSIVN